MIMKNLFEGKKRKKGEEQKGKNESQGWALFVFLLSLFLSFSLFFSIAFREKTSRGVKWRGGVIVVMEGAS